MMVASLLCNSIQPKQMNFTNLYTGCMSWPYTLIIYLFNFFDSLKFGNSCQATEMVKSNFVKSAEKT